MVAGIAPNLSLLYVSSMAVLVIVGSILLGVIAPCRDADVATSGERPLARLPYITSGLSLAINTVNAECTRQETARKIGIVFVIVGAVGIMALQASCACAFQATFFGNRQ